MNSTKPVDILLVEDNPDDAELTMRGLAQHNLAESVIVARDGAEALHFIFCTGEYAGRSRVENPKLILLDLKLPKIDGLEVLRRIKADRRTKSIPVVVLTSSCEEQDVVDSYELGANSYMVKPLGLEDFIACVRKLGMYWLLYNTPPPR